MASAQSYEANLPETSIPNQLAGNNGYQIGQTGQSIWAQMSKWLSGYDASQHYQNLLAENNRAYEQALLKESRAYDAYLRQYNAQREDSQYQRMVKDMKAAGLNPWLALQGGVSGSSAQSQPHSDTRNISSGSSAKSKEKENSSSLAGLLVGIAKIIAAVAA